MYAASTATRTDLDLDVMRTPVVLELAGVEATLDEQRKMDFVSALKRCRLHVTAHVAYEDPVFYDVPVYTGMVNATSLVREMSARGRPIVYATHKQLVSLLNGIESLFDFGTAEPPVVINAKEVQSSIAKAIELRAATECLDPSALPAESFLYGYRPDMNRERDVEANMAASGMEASGKMAASAVGDMGKGGPSEKVKYFGVYVKRLTKRLNTKANDNDTLLTTARVLTVHPKEIISTLLL